MYFYVARARKLLYNVAPEEPYDDLFLNRDEDGMRAHARRIQIAL